VEGRRRSYILTAKGRQTLETEYRRLKWQMEDFERTFGKEEA
jgi:predicted transcriptional regulator